MLIRAVKRHQHQHHGQNLEKALTKLGLRLDKAQAKPEQSLGRPGQGLNITWTKVVHSLDNAWTKSGESLDNAGTEPEHKRCT